MKINLFLKQLSKILLFLSTILTCNYLYSQDSDGDNIINRFDLDDDNDGILDTNEVTCNFIEITPAMLGLSTGVNQSASNRDISSHLGLPAGTINVSFSGVNFGNTAGFTGAGRLWVSDLPSSGGAYRESSFTINSTKLYKLELIHGRFISTANKDDYFKITTGENYYQNFTPNANYSVITNGNIAGYATADVGLRRLPAASGSDGVTSGLGIQFTMSGYDNNSQFTAGTTDFDAVGLGGSNFWFRICIPTDTDGDGIPNDLDLDSDNDGCPDAVEGGANIISSQLINAAVGLSVGLGSTAFNQNLCNSTSCIDSNGVPNLTIGGQSSGDSQIVSINSQCLCYYLATWNGTNWQEYSPNINNNVKISANYDTSINGSFSCCNLTLDAGKKLDIKENNYVEVKNNILNNATSNEFIVHNNGNLIQILDTGTFTGNPITLYRTANMKRLDYIYWGSPVENQNLKNFSPNTLNNRFYTYNESNDLFDVINPLTNNFIKAKGYAIRASNNASSTLVPVTRSFVGIPNTGSFNFEITKSPNVIANNNASVEMGGNLISNPYPSNIDLDEFIDINTSVIYSTIYFWTNTNYNPPMQGVNYPSNLPGKAVINNYAVYNKSGGVPAPFGWTGGTGITDIVTLPLAPNNIVKPGQGFMVKSRTVAPPSGNPAVVSELRFKNSIRTKTFTNSQFYSRIKKPQIERYWLTLKTPLDFVSPILIAYSTKASNLYDNDFDAEAAISASDAFYSICENKKLVIQGRQTISNFEDKVYLGLKNPLEGRYEIALSKIDGELFVNTPIYLTDKFLNKRVNLQHESYTFNSSIGEFNDRFFISYKEENSLHLEEHLTKELIIFEIDQNIIIDSYHEMKKILIYDMNSRLIKFLKPSFKKVTIKKDFFHEGTYVFQIFLNHKTIYKKFIIK